MKSLELHQACPCGRLHQKKPMVYGACCGRWLEAATPAPDAESLMRSRYCAFVLEREGYLLKTWHPSHRPASIEFEPGVKWLGLEVRSHTVQDATHAQVEFVALYFSQIDGVVQLSECSRFQYLVDQWLYVDAIYLGTSEEKL